MTSGGWKNLTLKLIDPKLFYFILSLFKFLTLQEKLRKIFLSRKNMNQEKTLKIFLFPTHVRKIFLKVFFF